MLQPSHSPLILEGSTTDSICPNITTTPITTTADTGRPPSTKRLLPSEIKKRQSRKAKETCFSTSTNTNESSSVGQRKPLQSLSLNSEVSKKLKSSLLPSPLKELALPTSLVSEYSLQFTIPTTTDINDINTYITNNLKSLTYYQYPFPEFPPDSSKRLSNSFQRHRHQLSKTTSSSSSATTKFGTNNAIKNRFSEVEYFLTIIKGWRRALLSCYQEWKDGKMEHFYYKQSIPDISIIFRKGMEVLLPSSTKTLRDSLEREGITFSFPLDSEDFHRSAITSSIFPLDSDDDEDDETFMLNGAKNVSSKRKIRKVVDGRLNKDKMSETMRDQNQVKTISIKGSMMVHQLIDYLLMQEDLRSSIILPQLVAPEPFLHGTMLKLEVSFTTKALIDGSHSLKVVPSPLSSHFPPISIHAPLKAMVEEYAIEVRGDHFVPDEKMNSLNNKSL